MLWPFEHQDEAMLEYSLRVISAGCRRPAWFLEYRQSKQDCRDLFQLLSFRLPGC